MWTWMLAGCSGGGEVEFPAGLEPFAEVGAEWPAAADDTVAIASGEAEAYVWGHARGHVTAPLVDTWAALQDPDVTVDRRRVDEWTVETGVEPDYDVSFVVHTTVHDIVTVEYDLTWRQSAIDDDTVAIRWQKTDGSGLIETLEGSIVLTRVEDDVTGVEVVEHLRAATQGTAEVEQFVGDVFASVVEVAHGRDLPTYAE